MWFILDWAWVVFVALGSLAVICLVLIGVFWAVMAVLKEVTEDLEL